MDWLAVTTKVKFRVTGPRLNVSAKTMVAILALKTASEESPTQRIKFTEILALVKSRMNCPITHVIREFFDTGKHKLLEKVIEKRDRRSTYVQQPAGNTGERIRRVTNLSKLKLMVRCLHNGNDDNYDDDEDGTSDDETHLSESILSR